MNDLIEIFSLGHLLLHTVLPVVSITIVISIAWFWFCRWYCRAEERNWDGALREPNDFEELPLNVQVSVLSAQRAVAARGSPADRLFFAGLFIAASIVMVLAVMSMG